MAPRHQQAYFSREYQLLIVAFMIDICVLFSANYANRQMAAEEIFRLAAFCGRYLF